jgi:hypothetical protein
MWSSWLPNEMVLSFGVTNTFVRTFYNKGLHQRRESNSHVTFFNESVKNLRVSTHGTLKWRIGETTETTVVGETHSSVALVVWLKTALRRFVIMDKERRLNCLHLLYHRHRRKSRKCRKYWAHPLLLQRDKFGAFQTLWRIKNDEKIFCLCMFPKPCPTVLASPQQIILTIPDPHCSFQKTWWAHSRDALSTEGELRLADVTIVW